MTGKCNSYRVDGKEIRLDDRREYQGLQKLTREIRHIVQPILGKHGFAMRILLKIGRYWSGKIWRADYAGIICILHRQDRKTAFYMSKVQGGLLPCCWNIKKRA